MKLILFSLILAAAFLLGLIGGCDAVKTPTSSVPADDHASPQIVKGAPSAAPLSVVSLLPTDVTLCGFQIHYSGRTIAGNQTTFSYSVTGPGDDMHFRLELPGCAPQFPSFAPDGGVTSNNDPDIDPGVEWHPNSSGSGTITRTFSITYPGIVGEGIVLTSVKTTNLDQVGQISGACARVYKIAGSVFTDANTNGSKESNETGIPGATVTLLTGTNTVLGSATTPADGSYLFDLLPAGTYIVKVDTSTVTFTSTKYVSATTPTYLTVTLGPDAQSADFGFVPKSAKLLNDLKFGILPTNGATAGFWKKQIQIALSGGSNATVSKDRLLAYLSTIDNFLLDPPFDFPNGLLQSAYDILSKPTKTDLDALNQQLLATELNHVSGHGIISTDPTLQLVILEWCESIVASQTASRTITPAATTSTSTSTATDICRSISSGGGGGDFLQ